MPDGLPDSPDCQVCGLPDLNLVSGLPDCPGLNLLFCAIVFAPGLFYCLLRHGTVTGRNGIAHDAQTIARPKFQVLPACPPGLDAHPGSHGKRHKRNEFTRFEWTSCKL